MHLYLNYNKTVIEILCLSSETLKSASERLVELEKKLQRQLNLTVVYTELEANDSTRFFNSVYNAFEYLEELIAEAALDRESALNDLAETLQKHQISYRVRLDRIEIDEKFANLDYFFSVNIDKDSKNVHVYYDSSNLSRSGSRDYESIDEFIADILALKDLDAQFKTLVADTPFALRKER